MKSLLNLLAFCLSALTTFAQLGVNTQNPDPSSALHVNASDKGIIIPQVSLQSLTDQSTIKTPATSLLIYNNNGGLPSGVGYYFNAGTPNNPKWVKFLISDSVDTQAVGFNVTVALGAGQHFDANTDTKVNFPNETYDFGDNFHGDQFIAPQNGIYSFKGQIFPTATSEGWVSIYFKVNGIKRVNDQQRMEIMKFSTDLSLQKGDVVTFEINPNGQSFNIFTSPLVTYLSGHLVR